VHRITIGDGRSTEELVEAGRYGYAHSAVISDNFPTGAGPTRTRDIVLLLWDNAGRRELGLEGFDDPFSAACRFAFVRPFV
jgi:hypothetical protein